MVYGASVKLYKEPGLNDIIGTAGELEEFEVQEVRGEFVRGKVEAYGPFGEGAKGKLDGWFFASTLKKAVRWQWKVLLAVVGIIAAWSVWSFIQGLMAYVNQLSAEQRQMLNRMQAARATVAILCLIVIGIICAATGVGKFRF